MRALTGVLAEHPVAAGNLRAAWPAATLRDEAAWPLLCVE